MTYIIGLKQIGINAIIADSRISWDEEGINQGRNDSLKTGKLFPGCIFGRMGNVEQSRIFIQGFKKLNDGKDYCITEYWSRLESYFRNFDFNTQKPFKLLLSSRVFGEPTFYLLDSTNSILKINHPHENFMITYGSGKDYFDPIIGKLGKIVKLFSEEIIKSKIIPNHINPLEFTPYIVCLLLMQHTLGFESSCVEDTHRTGGIFHFIHQNHKGDSPQRPSIYIFSNANIIKKTIRGWIYRIIYDEGGLIIEKHSPLDTENEPQNLISRNSFWDTASRPSIENLSELEIKDLTNRIIDNAPFFNFLGFGFSDPNQRNSFGFEISSNGKKKDIFSDNGQLLEKWQEKIITNYN